VSPVTNLFDVLTIYLQLALENSAGAMKLKVVEYGADKPLEGLFLTNIINILGSEPLISVSPVNIEKENIYNCLFLFSWMQF